MPRAKSTTASIRKRGAEKAKSPESPIKKVKTAKDQSTASENIRKEIIHTDEEDANGLVVKTEKISEEKFINGTQSSPVKARGKKGAVAKSSKIEVIEEEAEDRIIPKKTTKRTKAEASKLEEEELDPSKGTPRKAKRKKADLEEKEETEAAADGEETPKKIKRRKKTKEEKEAEAMPLAARTTGLRMFVGAHVSSAKGALPEAGLTAWETIICRPTRAKILFPTFTRRSKCRYKLCPYWVKITSKPPFHRPTGFLTKRIRGNAFALFLKSQRKWDNPPLQDEHREGFKSNCVLHKYDAAR